MATLNLKVGDIKEVSLLHTDNNSNGQGLGPLVGCNVTWSVDDDTIVSLLGSYAMSNNAAACNTLSALKPGTTAVRATTDEGVETVLSVVVVNVPSQNLTISVA